MQRDMDLVRKILLEIEGWSTTSPRVIQYDFDDKNPVNYHFWLLYQAGFLEAETQRINPGQIILVRSLTWQGHEFLDDIRDESIWERQKMQPVKSDRFRWSF